MKKATKLQKDVMESINYFLGYRLEELKTDDVYYIKALIKYIRKQEKQILELEMYNAKQKMKRQPFDYNIDWNDKIRNCESYEELSKFIETDERATRDEKFRLRFHLKEKNISIPNV